MSELRSRDPLVYYAQSKSNIQARGDAVFMCGVRIRMELFFIHRREEKINHFDLVKIAYTELRSNSR